MNAPELIRHLRAAGVEIEVDGSCLRWRAPVGTITPELKEQLAKQKAEIIAMLTQAEQCGAGRPSPENSTRPVEDRCREALELLGELTYLYNERAAILEYQAGFPRAEAERRAMAETKATESYRRWLALG